MTSDDNIVDLIGNLPQISSARHEVAVIVSKVSKRPQTARRLGLFLLDGIHLFEEVHRSSYEPEAILFAPGLLDRTDGRELISELYRKQWPLYQTSEKLMNQLSPLEAPQGILGLFQRPVSTHLPSIEQDAALKTESAAQPDSTALYLLFAGLQNPGNLGALARTAAAFDCRGLVTSENTIDPLHARTIRASSGAILHLPLFPGSTVEELKRWRDSFDIAFVSFTAHGGQEITDVGRFLASNRSELGNRSICLVLGAEGAGIPGPIAEICQFHWRLHLADQIESLGVTAAGTLGIYLINQLLQPTA